MELSEPRAGPSGSRIHRDRDARGSRGGYVDCLSDGHGGGPGPEVPAVGVSVPEAIHPCAHHVFDAAVDASSGVRGPPQLGGGEALRRSERPRRIRPFERGRDAIQRRRTRPCRPGQTREVGNCGPGPDRQGPEGEGGGDSSNQLHVDSRGRGGIRSQNIRASAGQVPSHGTAGGREGLVSPIGPAIPRAAAAGSPRRG